MAVAVPVGERFDVGLVEVRTYLVANLLDRVVPRLRPNAVLIERRLECGRRSLPVLKAHARDGIFWQRGLDLDELTVGEHHDAAGLIAVLRAMQIALLQAEADAPRRHERKGWQHEECGPEGPRRCVEADVVLLRKDVVAAGK